MAFIKKDFLGLYSAFNPFTLELLQGNILLLYSLRTNVSSDSSIKWMESADGITAISDGVLYQNTAFFSKTVLKVHTFRSKEVHTDLGEIKKNSVSITRFYQFKAHTRSHTQHTKVY